MGMFDRIRFENDIPDPHLRDEEWQTKSLENALLDYRVSADGKLFVTRKEYDTKEAPDSLFGLSLYVVDEWEDRVDHHGVVEAYCYRRGEDQSHAVNDGTVIRAQERDGRVVLWGRTLPTGDEPTVDTDGIIEHTGGLAVTLLAEARRPDGSLVLALPPESFLGDA